MGVSAGPDIIEDGLTIYINGFDKNSYPGSGTTWNDLSGNAFNVILQNGPTYALSSYFNFDGTNDYGYVKTINYGAGTTISEMSVFAWVATDYTAGTLGTWNNNNWALLDFDRSEVFTFAINDSGEVQMNGFSANNGGIGTSNYDILSNTAINDGTWHYIGWTFSVSNQKIIMYVDGQVDRIFTADGNMTALGNGGLRYGVIGDGSEMSTENGIKNDIYFQGDIQSLFFYDNKALTPDEVLQNYNATKRRMDLLYRDPIDPLPVPITGYAFLFDAQHNRSLRQFTTNTWFDIGGQTQDNHMIMYNVGHNYVNSRWEFNGSNSYGTIVNDDLINNNSTNWSSKTISSWFYSHNPTKAGGTNNEQFIYEQGGSGNGMSLYVYSGSIYGGVWSDTQGWSNGADPLNLGTFLSHSINQDQWYHAWFGFQPSGSGYEATLYVNGQPVQRGSVGGLLNGAHTGDIIIGLGDSRTHLGNTSAKVTYYDGYLGYLKSTNLTFTDSTVFAEFSQYSSSYGY